MTDEVAQELRSLRELVVTLVRNSGVRLNREQMCQRYDCSPSTLARRIKAGTIPRPGRDGKWLLSDLVEWERLQTAGHV